MTNKKNYDSDFCGSLPLNLVNMIQPHGYLLVLSRDLQIIQASENVADLLQSPLKEIVPSSFNAWLEPDHQESAIEKIKAIHGDRGLLSLHFKGNGTELFAIVHPKDDHIILELEPVQARNQFIDVFQHIKPSMTAIEQ
ncbi:MAG TPA: phytochrome, partial [Sphingobacteriaceae bacterium]